MMTFLPRRLALAAILGAFATIGPACSSSSSGTPSDAIDVPDGGGACATTGAGTLEIKVSGLPDGVDGAVAVDANPAPTTRTVSLPLPAGVHDVTARRVAQADPVVRPVFDPTIDQAKPCVKDGATTTVNVTYAKVPTSNTLWMPHGNGTEALASFPGSALRVSGDTTTSTYALKVPGISTLAFDAEGNMWFSSTNVQRVKASSLAAPGAATPDVVLDGEIFRGGVPSASALAFDKDGNLWVSIVVTKKIVKIAAASLVASGEITPAVEIDNPAFGGLDALAFDKDGNLFVTNGNRISIYKAARLAASTSAPPDIEITGKTPSPVIGELSDAAGLAFDVAGNLWVSYFASNVLAKYTPAELATTAEITPATQLKIGVTTLIYGIAFDESGGLWFSAGSGKVGRLAPEQLVPSATPVTPTVIVNGGPTGLGQVSNMAFFPAPSALPILPHVE
jgi:sugar lactone lactonase YvrE